MVAKHPASSRKEARSWACFYAVDHRVVSAPIRSGFVYVTYFESDPKYWGWYNCGEFAN